MIPLKLIKIVAVVIAEPVMLAKNCCFCQEIFPDNTKTASTVTLDKGKPNK